MNLIASTSTFSFFTLISRVLGYFRDILIAIFLGTSVYADAFFVAFRIPNTFRRLLSEGTFNAAFVPSYAGLVAKNKLLAQSFAKNIFNFLFVGLLLIILIAEIFMHQIVFVIAPGFSDNLELVNLTTKLCRITFPFLFFVCLASFFSAILNTHNKFGFAAAIPIILNVILISSLLISKYIDLPEVELLSYAVTFAGLVQFISLIFYTKKYFKFSIEFKLSMNKKLKFFFKKLLPSVLSSGVVQINILIGTIIASFQSGAVSYLYYADRLYQITLAIAGIAVGTVILPELSKKIKLNNYKLAQDLQSKSINLCLFISLPAAVGLYIASYDIVNALFGYGSFTEISVKNTSAALKFFAIGIPAFALLKIFSSFYFARNNTQTPFHLSVIVVVINLVLSIYLFRIIGFIAIPIATTISTWIIVFAYIFKFVEKDIHKFDNIFFRKIIKMFLSSALMAIFLIYMISFLADKLIYDSSLKILYLFLIVGLSIVVYFLISVLIGTIKFGRKKNIII